MIAVAVMVVVAVACGIFIVYTSRSRSTGVSVPDVHKATLTAPQERFTYLYPSPSHTPFATQQTFSAQFIVSPPEGSTDDWKYNGKMYKTKAGASTVSGSSDPDDWVVEATVETVDAETNKRIVYTLHNRRAYYQQFPSPDATTAEESGCMRQSHVPAMGDINNLMKNAAQVPKDEVRLTPLSAPLARQTHLPHPLSLLLSRYRLPRSRLLARVVTRMRLVTQSSGATTTPRA